MPEHVCYAMGAGVVTNPMTNLKVTVRNWSVCLLGVNITDFINMSSSRSF